MKTGHTPGEWLATDDNEQVIQVDDMGSSIVCDLNTSLKYQANAQLIASAPELLEALKEIVKEVDGLAYYNDTPCSNACNKAKKAIAKATGKAL